MRNHDATQFIDEAETRGILAPKLVDKLRQQVANSKRQYSAGDIAKILVDKQFLSKLMAESILLAIQKQMVVQARLLQIRFSCPKCEAMHKVKCASAGKQVSCLKCSSAISVPRPGQNWLRKRCSECGTEHESSHNGICQACRASATELAKWCTLHRCLLEDEACENCCIGFHGIAALVLPQPMKAPSTPNLSAGPMDSTPSQGLVPPTPDTATLMDAPTDSSDTPPGISLPGVSPANSQTSMPLQDQDNTTEIRSSVESNLVHPFFLEIPGSFYLGRRFDLNKSELCDDLVNYVASDLRTHAICLGMTGCGKTGLGVSILEEAAIDGIPAICVDPRGDLGNLLLTFPDLAPGDFQKWVDPVEASHEGISIAELASRTANKRKEELAGWNQGRERIQRLRDAVDISIYTPGSNIGLPLTVLKCYEAPPDIVIEDNEIMREKVSGAASGFLTLLGMDANPLTSKEHILLSHIFDRSWRAGKSLDLGELIRQIQAPPIDRIGVLDVETFMPKEQRVSLAMSLNNLLASPSAAGWLEGESLDIKKLLFTSEGKPRLSILNIAHLNDAERMFFVTMLLGEMLTWMQAQAGTDSLRAIFYMDEIFGFFPPSAEPPSKQPMLTLLKQARGYGLGICLATQNPADIDYKGLANIGTWFLGRLQTESDKQRVLEGLEGAAAQQCSGFDRSMTEQQLAALGNRVFLMKNIHNDSPTIFQSRSTLSYLKGPLSKDAIKELMVEKRKDNKASKGEPNKSISNSKSGVRPIVPPGITERFLIPEKKVPLSNRMIYRPSVIAQASVHFVKATANVNYWKDITLLVSTTRGLSDDLWESAEEIHADSFQLAKQPDDGVAFANLPLELGVARNYTKWEQLLLDYIYRYVKVQIFKCKAINRSSQPGQTEAEARIELSHSAREARDKETSALKSRYTDKVRLLEKRVRIAQQELDNMREQTKAKMLDSVHGMGTSVLNALHGDQTASKSDLLKASSIAKNMGRLASERGKVARAEETLNEILIDKNNLEEQCQAEIDAIADKYSPANLALEVTEIPVKKTDTIVKLLGLVWVPYQVDPNGIASPLVGLPSEFQ